MLKCQLCEFTCVNNLGGALTIHLKDDHSMTMRDYAVHTEYEGVPPKCACGICDEEPKFYRGKFLRIAEFHNHDDVREELYVSRYGKPRCPVCGADVPFHRGLPKRTCSHACGIWGKSFYDPINRSKAASASGCRLSGLHKTLRARLKLSDLGFVSEQFIHRYFVDELHLEKKIIIEINGDYVHANPRKFGPEFEIHVGRHRYLAKDKWARDAERQQFLEELGYHVMVIWQSDDLETMRKELEQLLQ